MQRAAERDQQGRRERRAKGRGRILVCAAAVPAVLLVAGCSSGSDSGSGDSGSKASGSGGTSSSAGAGATATVQAAAYKKLPDSCGVLSKKTLKSLVPEAKSGKEGTSSDTATRASCSWSSLDNNGVKGSQFRWLNVSLLRFESDATRGEGDQLAHAYYAKQIKDAQAVEGAKNAKTTTVAGTGDEATLVRYDLKKKEGAFKQQTVVTRVENVVVTVDYNGAGLAGEKTPNAETLAKLAEQAAKEAVATVSAANGDGTAQSSPSASPSKSASKSASPTPSKSSSASPSSSASKKS
ncbi:DUF3558 family protein [Streptomyces sp. NPDC047081]|uniref:DUF3558 family protein n=1 Tax=Streptomyces sp. NPDC047081 TaxID=3154706 RepID=UPI0033ED327B